MLGSHEVAPGAVTPVVVGDHDLVVWRSAGGVVAACDSRCPHQWTHLGAQGVVDGEELVCLSHFWRFDPDGHGSKQATNGRRDPKGDVAAFAVREVAGRIEVRLPDAFA